MSSLGACKFVLRKVRVTAADTVAAADSTASTITFILLFAAVRTRKSLLDCRDHRKSHLATMGLRIEILKKLIAQVNELNGHNFRVQ